MSNVEIQNIRAVSQKINSITLNVVKPAPLKNEVLLVNYNQILKNMNRLETVSTPPPTTVLLDPSHPLLDQSNFMMARATKCTNSFFQWDASSSTITMPWTMNNWPGNNCCYLSFHMATIPNKIYAFQIQVGADNQTYGRGKWHLVSDPAGLNADFAAAMSQVIVTGFQAQSDHAIIHLTYMPKEPNFPLAENSVGVFFSFKLTPLE